MKLGRRGFFGVVGGAAAMPAAKVLNAAGVDTNPIATPRLPDMDLIPGGFGSAPTVSKGVVDYWLERKAKALALKTLNPPWFQEKRRRDAYFVGALDLDLASFVSVSPAMKITIQRERQYQRFFDQEEKYNDMRHGENLFNETL